METSHIAGSEAARLLPTELVDDLHWERIAAEADQSPPSSSLTISSSSSSTSSSVLAALKRGTTSKRAHLRAAAEERTRRDAEILRVHEVEIPKEGKLIILVSRDLNEREGAPGRVFRELVKEHLRRCGERSASARVQEAAVQENAENAAGEEEEEEEGLWFDEDDDYDESVDCVYDDEDDPPPTPSRPACSDAHSVVYHVTSSLLSYRPALRSSSRLIQQTRLAAEMLVFGELYDSVYGEISHECREADGSLLEKMGTYEMSTGGRGTGVRGEDVSIEALGALLGMGEARCPSDKLALCAEFVEGVSQHLCGAQERSRRKKEGAAPAATEGRIGESSAEFDAFACQTEDKAGNNVVDGDRDDDILTGDGAGEDGCDAEAQGADSLLRIVSEHVLVAKVRVKRANGEMRGEKVAGRSKRDDTPRPISALAPLQNTADGRFKCLRRGR